MGRIKRIWYLSPMRAAKVQASLRIRAVSPEPPLFAHTSSESRGTFRQKARSLAPLNGWACAVKICHDGMLEDTNLLDAPHILVIFKMLFYVIFICLCSYSVNSILSTFLFTTVSGQDTPTAEEKATGLAIANKLSDLMRPTLSRASIKGMSRGLGMKKSAVSGNQYLDFQLIVDSSGSIGSSNFDVAKDATNVSL